MNTSPKMNTQEPSIKPPQTPPEKTEASTIEYFEVISSPKWLRASFYSFFGILIGFFLFFPLWSQEPDNPTNLILCLVFTFCLFAFMNFFSLRITLYSDKIQFGFYLYYKQFEYHDIKSCEIVKYELADYFNLGPKDGPHGETYYTVPGRHRQGIKLVVHEGRTGPTYILSSKRPEVINKRIQAKISKGNPNRTITLLPESRTE